MSSDLYGVPDITGGDFSVVATIAIVYMLFLFLMSAYSIMVYVFHSLGLYTIANRRGVHHPWLAWLPVGSDWILGSIADQYQYVAKGKVKNRRKVLLGLVIAIFVLMIVFFVAFFIALFAGIGSQFDPSIDEIQIIVPGIISMIAYFVMFVIALIATVYQYVCYYDLFASTSPNNAVAFLILSIFFTFLLPFFVFAVRKKDQGMPPRRPQIPAAPWQPSPAPAQPTWQSSAQPQIPDMQQPVTEAPTEEPAPEKEPDISTEE